ncbi:MAG TPA: response regulator [Flavobacteriales bacterium]|nr:response regulator [Flavobacteriales bacterium]
MDTPIKLLVCEDDPNLGSLLAQYLLAKGFVVEHRKDGEQGWAAYAEGGFDLLVLDVMMPKLDGFSLARRIREKDARTPIIFLTAKSMKQDTITGFQAGADDYYLMLAAGSPTPGALTLAEVANAWGGTDTLVRLGGTDHIRLVGVTAASVDLDDFMAMNDAA